MLLQMTGLPSFLRLKSILLYVYTTFYFSIHLSFLKNKTNKKKKKHFCHLVRPVLVSPDLSPVLPQLPTAAPLHWLPNLKLSCPLLMVVFAPNVSISPSVSVSFLLSHSFPAQIFHFWSGLIFVLRTLSPLQKPSFDSFCASHPQYLPSFRKGFRNS